MYGSKTVTESVTRRRTFNEDLKSGYPNLIVTSCGVYHLDSSILVNEQYLQIQVTFSEQFLLSTLKMKTFHYQL